MTSETKFYSWSSRAWFAAWENRDKSSFNLWENRTSASCSCCRTCIRSLKLCPSVSLARALTRFCLAAASYRWVPARTSPWRWRKARRAVSRWSFCASRACCASNLPVSWLVNLRYVLGHCTREGLTPGLTRYRMETWNIPHAELLDETFALAGSFKRMSDIWKGFSSSSCVQNPLLEQSFRPCQSHCWARSLCLPVECSFRQTPRSRHAKECDREICTRCQSRGCGFRCTQVKQVSNDDLMERFWKSDLEP